MAASSRAAASQRSHCRRIVHLVPYADRKRLYADRKRLYADRKRIFADRKTPYSDQERPSRSFAVEVPWQHRRARRLPRGRTAAGSTAASSSLSIYSPSSSGLSNYQTEIPRVCPSIRRVCPSIRLVGEDCGYRCSVVARRGFPEVALPQDRPPLLREMMLGNLRSGRDCGSDLGFG